ncbi:MAG TPA: glutathione peroxidase [Steroidobacteraceae bacterium]|jgi:glutathione peroxidase|nr:glutathione peroxidase [Steroidobacteraceae bacterium]
MSVYDYSARSIDGQQQSLADWRGETLLIVNVASRCGFTPQYSGLEALYRRFRARGFAVLGFPCDQFGHQEPGDEAEIRTFCTTQYEVSFPLFAKIEVNGPNAHPLYRYLCNSLPGLLGLTAIKWNFTKFLVGAGGEPVRRFAPADKPERLAEAISAQLPRAAAGDPQSSGAG